MLNLERYLQRNRTVRAIGFDDAPFTCGRGEPVSVAGVICAGTRFEGMVWGQVQKDGSDATHTLAAILMQSKFADQVHIVLLDGLNVAGFNLIDLPQLAQQTQRPCVAVMRKMPNFDAIALALRNFDDCDRRMELVRKAGQVHRAPQCFFQVCGCTPAAASAAITRITDTGHVPEPLRLAHLIGAAIVTGQSSSRA